MKSFDEVDHKLAVLTTKVTNYEGGVFGLFHLVPVKTAQGSVKLAMTNCMKDITALATNGTETKLEAEAIVTQIKEWQAKVRSTMSAYVLRRQEFGMWRSVIQYDLNGLKQYTDAFADTLMTVIPPDYAEVSATMKAEVENLFDKVLGFYA